MKKISLEELDIKSPDYFKDFFKLELFNMVDSSDISVPMAVVGKESERIVTIVAGQHGNEWSGPYIGHMLYKKLDPSKMKGRVIILPIANPPAFLQKARVSSLDHIDMNRTYGFVKKRKPTEHIANVVFEEFCIKSEFVIDLHSGGPGEYHPLVETSTDERIEIAKSLNIGHIIAIKKDSSSLVPNCEKYGVKAFSVEAGCALDINYDYANIVVDGLMNFLKTVGVVEGEPKTDENQKIYQKKIIFPSEASGFFEPKMKLLEKVKEGQEICKIWPFFENGPKSISSPMDGTIVYLRTHKIISEGESICHIAN